MKSSMRIIILWGLWMPVLAAAQPAGSAASGSGSANDPGSGSAGSAAPAPAPAPTPMPEDSQLTKICGRAMDNDPAFADKVIKTAEEKLHDEVNRAQVAKDLCTLKMQEDAQTTIAKNQKHVILAYAAMWLVAAGFVLFLWRRQQALKSEIAQLHRDLDAAAKDPK